MTDGFRSADRPVRPEWIDYNGHVRDGYYLVAVSEANEDLLDALDLGEGYLARTGCSMYTVEASLRYLHETKADDVLHAVGSLLSADRKRVRVQQVLCRADDVELATAELLYLHVNQATGKVEPMPDAQWAKVTATLAFGS